MTKVFTGKRMLFVLVPFLILASCGNVFAEQNIHALRSAYLYYFSHFIQWPDIAVFDNEQFNLCAITENADDKFQLETIKNKKSGNMTLKISIYNANQFSKSWKTEHQALKSCHLIYFSQAVDRALIPEYRQYLSTSVFVTEGDIINSEDMNNIGDIHLFRNDNKLNFYIDSTALRNKHFEASSKLLRLSKQVAYKQAKVP